MSLCGECQREAPQGAVFCAFCGAPLGPSGGAEVLGALAGATIAGRYFLESLIGRGGMGDVYRATDLALDRTVVVKLLRRTGTGGEAGAERFQREARAAAHLSHPSSVALLDSGETEAGLLYMAMELVPGVTLARLLSERGSLPARRTVAIGAQILAALAEAHGLGIVHRDLKPANVMVDVRDGEDRVKVLDFGIAIFRAADPDARLTQQGQVFGTPAYMSPEQVRGEPLDARSDLYSVGVLLYELLAGKLPFDAGTAMELAARHLTDAPPPMAERSPGIAVSRELEALVLSALAKDRTERPPSAEAFRSALLACPVAEAGPEPSLPSLAPTAPLDGKGVAEAARRSTGPLPPALAARPTGRRWAGWAASLAGTAILATGGIAALVLARRAPPTPTAVQPGTPSAPAPATPPPTTRATVIPASQDPGAAASDPPRPEGSAAGPAPRAPGAAPPRAPRPARAAAAGSRPAPVAPAADEPGSPGKPAAVEHGPGIRAVRGELDSLPLPAASSGDGLLAIEASPWAEVSIDGEKLGETPREVQLAAGVHLVRAVHPELGAREARVSVRAGHRTVWVAEME